MLFKHRGKRPEVHPSAWVAAAGGPDLMRGVMARQSAWFEAQPDDRAL
jgi:hypothetical protein